MDDLAAAGVDFKDVTDLLLKEGVQKFAKSFDDLIGAVRSKREQFARLSRARLIGSSRNRNRESANRP